MTTKEKAPTSAATLTGAATEMTACRASIPVFNCTTETAGRQWKVSDLLNRGRENAVPLRHLKKLLGVDGRTVRLMIERERRSEDEKAACVRSMRHRAGEIMRTARAIEEAAALD